MHGFVKFAYLNLMKLAISKIFQTTMPEINGLE